MRASRLELPGFLVLAVAMHVALWPVRDEFGVQASGAVGQAQVSLLASAASLEVLVESWETPPSAGPEPVSMRPPPTTPAMTVPEVRPHTPVPHVLPARPVVAQAQERLPDAAQQPPPRLPRRPERTLAPTEDSVQAALPSPPQPSPTAETPSASSDSSAAQTARGSKGGSAAGQSSASETAVGQGDAQRHLARWGGKIRAAIERRKRYPRGLRVSGTVRLSLMVSTDGSLVSYALISSSGNAALDDAARNAVRTARYPRARGGVPAGNHGFNITLSFAP
ncbi:TonB family protein [Aliiroseovarius sp.]|uniref:TonB family protein n=1 Tax=Aliiroseovarius sp. TaxID=1872442 RepID=UPI003BABE3B6